MSSWETIMGDDDDFGERSTLPRQPAQAGADARGFVQRRHDDRHAGLTGRCAGPDGWCTADPRHKAPQQNYCRGALENCQDRQSAAQGLRRGIDRVTVSPRTTWQACRRA